MKNASGGNNHIRVTVAGLCSLVALCWAGLCSAQTPSDTDPRAMPKAAKPPSLTVGAVGGSYDECLRHTYYADFTKKTSIPIKIGSSLFDIGNWNAQQMTGNVEWDVTEAPTGIVDELIQKGYLQPINMDFVQHFGGLLNFPDLTSREFAGKDYYLANELAASVIVWNNSVFKNTAPRTWADVFDTKKFPGKRMFPKNVRSYGTLEMALLADGVPLSKLYPLDVNRALKKLNTIKDDIVWWTSGDQQVQFLIQGEAVIGAAWDGRVKFMQKASPNIGFTYNQAVAFASAAWTVPTGSHHSEWGTYLVHFVAQPKEQAKFAVCLGYSPTMMEAYKHLPPDSHFAVPINNPNDMSQIAKWSLEYWRANGQKISRQFDEWLIER